MQLVSIVVAMLAATNVQAAAMEKWCAYPGQGCSVMKRAADATNDIKRSAEALAKAMPDASPDALQKWCYLPGQGCHKIKRAAEAVNDVKRSAEVMAAIDEE
ncbi:hypothetical protein ASPWEDRAFT_26227 [Aspergillus wentii DTO 134E9]|uniref:Mating alpha-pheromone PpgA n=1 Tax=Aspergillus wentii DTO 134E9 TaxID=1073089 RepID=A0A1L9RPJ3_ASPWE|nr:uncharacterized protein ASPWEDRAFT_26227 [Aspergillus wentii DTO 134E9]KAI9923528.1 hypothetical protein MW887_008594 [Aspergillus wentii]OJJ36773.1 hypothetical protein ASPWEDRAFT_26227 [Aspergillus wentii DTO 134E9]